MNRSRTLTMSYRGALIILVPCKQHGTLASSNLTFCFVQKKLFIILTAVPAQSASLQTSPQIATPIHKSVIHKSAPETVTLLLDFPRDFGYIGKANIIVRLPLLGRAEP